MTIPGAASFSSTFLVSFSLSRSEKRLGPITNYTHLAEIIIKKRFQYSEFNIFYFLFFLRAMLSIAICTPFFADKLKLAGAKQKIKKIKNQMDFHRYVQIKHNDIILQHTHVQA